MSSGKKRKAEDLLHNLFRPRPPTPSVPPAVDNTGAHTTTSTSQPISNNTAMTMPPAPSASNQVTPTGNPQPEAPIPSASASAQQNIRHAAWSGLDRFVTLMVKLGVGTLGPLKSATDDVAKCIEVFEVRSRPHGVV